MASPVPFIIGGIALLIFALKGGKKPALAPPVPEEPYVANKAVLAAKEKLDRWGKNENAATMPDWPESFQALIDVQDKVDDRFIAAVAVFQKWANYGTADAAKIRQDGVYDSATENILNAYLLDIGVDVGGIDFHPKGT